MDKTLNYEFKSTGSNPAKLYLFFYLVMSFSIINKYLNFRLPFIKVEATKKIVVHR